MELVVFLLCLLVTTQAAPAPDSESNEQLAAHANQALRWMEMYRLYQQQGAVGNLFPPASDAPADAAPADVPPPAPVAVEDASEEETEVGKPVPKAGAPPAAPVNSDEVEEAEEVEAADAEPAEEAAVETTADLAAAVEPALVDVPVGAVPVNAAAVDGPPVDGFSVDIAPVAPEVATYIITPAPAGAAPPAVEVEMTGVAADPAAQ
ncbi:enamelin isoform X1 [Channa argus]|uniref:enamelin isoform X1 n=1 Tax=Channa argus TaxID=215402 RepID=UPI00352287AB